MTFIVIYLHTDMTEIYTTRVEQLNKTVVFVYRPNFLLYISLLRMKDEPIFDEACQG